MSLLMTSITAALLLTDASGLERRLWEVQVRKFEEQDKSEEYPSDSVLFFGSSSIRRWDSITDDVAPYPVIQRGYGGARLSDAVGYVERVVYPHEFRALVLYIANDLQGMKRDRTPQEVAELFRELLAKVRARYPQTPVFWVAVSPTPSRWSFYADNVVAGELIREICDGDDHAYFVDTEDLFLETVDGQERPRTDVFKSDRLHLNDFGYSIWSERILAALDDVLSPVPARPAESDVGRSEGCSPAEVFPSRNQTWQSTCRPSRTPMRSRRLFRFRCLQALRRYR